VDGDKWIETRGWRHVDETSGLRQVDRDKWIDMDRYKLIETSGWRQVDRDKWIETS